ncbi:hypothetical protein TRFO_17339 [Tritrichomonas foetus]|uniref:Thioredoxin domain-containing protein n=1 Tax=Tritrichomonas foetus TaxID=1144522 RepID=A0A1J4KNL5_9EUKA|nr:hypothetical protein TRFO_17339 [Tritrichomonas foetus]|eukprot:OHT12722.1 hypothetical protein TRFO_17339 [Tritrichomonas foetus]
MLIFTLFLLWWEYNEDEFQKVFDDTWNKPLYAVCYSPNCPHCHGLPGRFIMFAKSMAERNDIIYTAIDITNSTACQKLGARFIPYFVFARGTNRKYWLYPQFNCPIRWIEFIEDWGNPKIEKLNLINKSLNHYEKERELIRKTLNGGSTFHLKVPENHSILSKYEDLSKKFRVYNDTFILSENNDLKNSRPEIIVYTSTNCSQTFEVNSSNLNKIVNNYKFSSLHHLDRKEWGKLSKSSNTVIFMNDGELNGTRLELLDQLSNEFCGVAKFGWAIIKDQKAISITLKQNNDIPYIAVINKNNSCQFISNLEEDFDKMKEFISASLGETTKCQKFNVGTSVKNKIRMNWKILTKPSFVYGTVILFLVVITSLVLFFKFYHSQEQKLE